jgi:hypothetical protein
MKHFDAPDEQSLTSSSFILLSNPAIFSAFSSFASPSFLPSSFSVEYVRRAARAREAVEALGLACLARTLRSGCRDDNERDIMVV